MKLEVCLEENGLFATPAGRHTTVGEAGPHSATSDRDIRIPSSPRPKEAPPVFPEITTTGSKPGDALRRGRTVRRQWSPPDDCGLGRGHHRLESPCGGPDPPARHPGAAEGDGGVQKPHR